MKRVLSIFVLMCMCIGLVGCGGSDDTSGVQDKMGEAGYIVKLNNNLDDVVKNDLADIVFSKDNEETYDISLLMNKKDSKVLTINFRLAKTDGTVKNISYDVADKVNIGYLSLDDKVVCQSYNLDKDIFLNAEAESKSISCGEKERNILQSQLEERNNLLKDIGITIGDFEKFGNWFYEKHK